MPMLDAFIPDGALSAEAENQLLGELTDILLRHEGADPTDPTARSLTWVFLHRPTAVFVAGERAAAPRYRIVASVPEGQFDDDRRQALVEAVTAAVLDAEQGAYQHDPMRVWVFANEVADGTWGGGGRIVRLADIVALVTGNADRARRHAQQRLPVGDTPPRRPPPPDSPAPGGRRNRPGQLSRNARR